MMNKLEDKYVGRVHYDFDDPDIIDAADDLLLCFPGSIVNAQGDFVADIPANAYFNLGNCKDYREVKCKVLEWFSQNAYKTEPFRTKHRNAKFHDKMLTGINDFLGTEFNEEDMELIYTHLGNSIDRGRTHRFIANGYFMGILTEDNWTGDRKETDTLTVEVPVKADETTGAISTIRLKIIGRGNNKISIVSSSSVIVDVDFMIRLLNDFKNGERDKGVKE